MLGCSCIFSPSPVKTAWIRLVLISALLVLPLEGWPQSDEGSPGESPSTTSDEEDADDEGSPGESSSTTAAGEESSRERTDVASDVPATAEPAVPEAPSGDTNAHRVGRMPALLGHTGIFHLQTADSVDPQTFTLGLFGEYFQASNVAREGDENRRFTGRLGVTYTITDYLEAFMGLMGRGNLNNLGLPNLIQTQGDLSLGLKAFARLAPGLQGGASLSILFLNGENSIGFDFGATSADFRGLLSYSLVEELELPLVVHLNLGYLLDNSANLFEAELQRVERFAHQVSEFDRFEIGLGIEVPLSYVTPSLEWNLGLPLGGSDLDCDEVVVPCPWDVGMSSFPHTLTLGLKGAPISGLVLSLGLDLSLTRDEATGLPAQAPYNVMFGLAYHLDPRPPEVAPPVTAAVAATPPPQEGWILGEVVSQETGEPIGSALVSYPDTSLTAQSTDTTTGRFRSYEFPSAAEVTVQISHPTHETRVFTRAIPVGEDGIRIRLSPSSSSAAISGQVVDAAGAFLPATIFLAGPQTLQFDVDPLDSHFEQQIPIGRYVGTIVADGYVSHRETLEVRAGQMDWNITLDPLPQGQVAVLRGDRIDLSGERITFTENSASLEPVAEEILDQVASLLDDYPDITLRIVAHCDDTGTVELTEQQAMAVVDYLTGLGIDPVRLQAEGRGGAEPLFPNISRRNRMRNQRVELLFGR